MDVNLALQKCNNIFIDAVRRYKEKCPNRRVQNRQELYTYHIQSTQDVMRHDAFSRHAFCQWFTQQSAENPTLAAEV